MSLVATIMMSAVLEQRSVGCGWVSWTWKLRGIHPWSWKSGKSKVWSKEMLRRNLEVISDKWWQMQRKVRRTSYWGGIGGRRWIGWLLPCVNPGLGVPYQSWNGQDLGFSHLNANRHSVLGEQFALVSLPIPSYPWERPQILTIPKSLPNDQILPTVYMK